MFPIFSHSLSSHGRTPLFSQKSTPKPIGRFRTHMIMSRFTNGCFVDRSFPFEGFSFGKRFVEQLVNIDLALLIVFFLFSPLSFISNKSLRRVHRVYCVYVCTFSRKYIQCRNMYEINAKEINMRKRL